MTPRSRRRVPAALLLVAALVAGGCGSSRDGDESGDGARVVVSTSVLGDLVRNVGGDAVEVRVLLRRNGDPHGYEPRPNDVIAAADADLLIASGLGLDDWMDEIAEQAGGEGKLLVLGEQVEIVREDGEAHAHDPVGTADGGDGHDHDHGEVDPHWWHDPRNAQAAVAAIRDALTRAHPSAAADYARNADAYLRRLRAFDAAVESCMATIPPQRRKLVTDHDAFGYLADRYGLEVVGAVLPSLTTQAQPSAGDLAELARAIERTGVTTVFSQRALNGKLARAIAREAGVRSDDSLYGDALGPDGSPGSTYLGMEAHNADAIVRGLSDGRRGCPDALAIAAGRTG